MFRKLFVVTGLLLVMVAAAACGTGSSLPKDAVATVGDQPITESAFESRLADLEEQLPDQVPDEKESPEEYRDFQAQVLDYMVTLEIISQKSDDLGIEVTDEELQEQVDSIKQMFGGDQAQLEQALEEQGLTLEEFRTNLREQALVQEAVEAVAADIEVSEEEISSFYEENKQQYETREQREVRHILFTPETGEDGAQAAEATDEQWSKAYEEAMDVRNQITSGADFGEMAQEYSEDPGSKDSGGNLSFITPGSMVPAFEDAAFSLEPREISEPVKTQYGYHLIQVLEVKEGGTQSLDEVKDDVRKQLVEPKKREAWDEWLQSMREEIDVTVREGLERPTTTTVPADAGGTSDATASDTSGSGDE